MNYLNWARQLAATALLFIGDLCQAAIPALPEIPRQLTPVVQQNLNTARQPLAARQAVLLTEGEAINRQCTSLPPESAVYRDCLDRKARFNDGNVALEHDAKQFSETVDGAIATEIQRLKDEEILLTQKIDTTMRAIGNIGFNRRVDDYEAWLKLSQESQKEFEGQVVEEATEWFADGVKEAGLEAFKGFDKTKGERLVAWFKKNAGKNNLPAPDKVVAVIRRLYRFESKEQLVEDAKFLATVIERTAKALPVEDFAEGLPVLMDSICDLVPQKPMNTQCKAFRTTAKLTSGALYNNATRRVAVHEIERLNTMTETDLKTLQNYSNALKKFVTQRNEDRAKRKALEEI